MQPSLQLSTETVRPKRLKMALILGFLSGIGPLSIDMYLPAFPALSQELGASASITQLSLTACLIGLACGQLVAGPLSDMRGRRVPLLIGIFSYVIVSLLCAFSPNMPMFIAMRFLQGLAGSAGIVIARASVRDMYSGAELTKFFALLMLVNGAAPILAPIFGAEILQFTSWRGVFFVLSGLGLAMLLAVWFGMGETLPEERRMPGGISSTLSTFKRLSRDSSFMGYALTQGFVSAAMFAYISGSSFVLQEIYKVSPRGFSLIFALNGAGIILMSQVAGRLAGKVNTRKLLASGLLIATTGASLLLVAVSLQLGLIAVVIAFFLVVSSVGIVSTTTTSLALQNQGKTAGSASAMLGMLSFVVGGAAAPLVGLGGSGTALPLAVVMAVFVLGAIILFFSLNRKQDASH